MLESKALILAKIEANYGVDPVPVVATDAILTTVPTFELVGSAKARNVALPYYGKLPPINVGEGLKISFGVEIRGSGGTAVTPPRIGCLLRACNLTQTIGSSDVSYDPNSAEAGESVTLYFHRDAILHKILGALGSLKCSLKGDEPGMLNLELTGLYAAAHSTDTAFVAGTFGDAVIPPTFKSAAFTIQSYAGIISALNLDLGNKIAKRINANAAVPVYRYFIAGREVKGDCDPEVVAKTVYDPWTLWNAGTAGAVTATIGSATGNKCIISLPNVFLDAPKYGGREGVLTYALPFSAHPTITAGNNEISFKFS